MLDSYTNAIPKFFYRSPSEITGEIREISERICEINSLLNVRHMISDAITAESEGNFERKVEALNELAEFANKALQEMRGLEARLDLLKSELCDVIKPKGA